jgi:hypothetical protein
MQVRLNSFPLGGVVVDVGVVVGGVVVGGVVVDSGVVVGVVVDSCAKTNKEATKIGRAIKNHFFIFNFEN